MKCQNRRALLRLGLILAVVATLSTFVGSVSARPAKTPAEPLVLLVMDPLAKEMACACVKGYAQRDYRKLAAHVQSALKERVGIEFSDDLAESMAQLGRGRNVIVVGERSLVAAGAKRAALPCHPVCALTDMEGEITLTGSFVKRADDPARELKDISGRKLISGLAKTEESHAVIQAALRAAGVEPVGTLEERQSYSDAALDVLDSRSSPPPVAVIPSYGLRLLEGCGSVKPGELKVIGKTGPAPFVTVFIADSIEPAKQEKILKAFLEVKGNAKLLKAMESRNGFKPLPEGKSSGPQANNATGWPDWRGPGRDGRVTKLPAQLPKAAKVIWRKPAMPGGLAGVSVSEQRLILAERDFSEEHDVYRCLNTDNGELVWRLEIPARGHLDYGQSPRATPVIQGGRTFLLGAFGDLCCVNTSTGKVIWKRQLRREFGAELPTWGLCSTPLIVEDLLIVNPGAPKASLVAVDCSTGRTRWSAPGHPAAYASFIYGDFGGRRQIVGYDKHSLGGWDPKTGRRLWELVPSTEGDFNVPTPIAAEGGVITATENNGTRLYHFDERGGIIPKPAGQFGDLSPDTTTPVVTHGRVFGADHGLYCIDLRKGLRPVWHREEPAIGDYATLIADDYRVLVITLNGELILLDARSDDCAVISRLRLFEDDVEIYSHPALVGTRLYARGGTAIVCFDLDED